MKLCRQPVAEIDIFASILELPTNNKSEFQGPVTSAGAHCAHPYWLGGQEGPVAGPIAASRWCCGSPAGLLCCAVPSWPRRPMPDRADAAGRLCASTAMGLPC
jgi:hypothetical protein